MTNEEYTADIDITQEYHITPDKAWKHFKTITTHKMWVMHYCFRCGLYVQGLLHDLSKYSPEEFLAGARYYLGYRSPNDVERKIFGGSKAWMHHKGRNKHHYEYWTDCLMGGDSHKLIGVHMPNRYILEMFCDRVAACRVYHKDDFHTAQPLEYYLRNNPGQLVHPDTHRKLLFLLENYARKGEPFFDEIRAAVRSHGFRL